MLGLARLVKESIKDQCEIMSNLNLSLPGVSDRVNEAEELRMSEMLYDILRKYRLA